MCGQSFLRVEKGYKETPRALPPDPQVIDRFSIQENRHCRFFLNRRPYNKGARGPRGSLGLRAEKRQRPQNPGRQPFFIWEGLGVRLGAGFPKKKVGKLPGGPGGAPLGTSLPSFFV